MKRNCSLEDISDGKLYGIEDLVEASCNGCKGAAVCCHGMEALLSWTHMICTDLLLISGRALRSCYWIK
jgi:hypothetical protein